MIEKGVDPDVPDYDLNTPLNLYSIYQIYDRAIFNKLLEQDIRIDHPNIKGRTPYLNFYEKSDFENANKMLELGANIN